MRSVARDLRPVNRDDPDPHQPGLGAQLEHSVKQLANRLLVAGAKARDRRVIWNLVRADHAERDILPAAPLDRPRRAHTDRLPIHQQRDHHRRLVRRSSPTITTIGAIERLEVQLADRVEHNHARWSSA